MSYPFSRLSRALARLSSHRPGRMIPATLVLAPVAALSLAVLPPASPDPQAPAPRAGHDAAGVSIPVEHCAPEDCAAGEGLLGDAPAALADLAEADFGEGCSDCGYDREPDGGNRGSGIENLMAANRPVDVVRLRAEIISARDHCGLYAPRWRVECISSELAAAARRIPRNRDGDVLRREILKAADQLEAIAVANADPAQPRTRLRDTASGRVTSRPIRAIAAARIPAANAAASAVIDTLTTTLLRSAPSDAARRVSFERTAEALGSTKVLLRSV